jgi:hypothetical protein
MGDSKVLAEAVIFVVGGTNDAPGFKIVPDGHGGFKVVPVPGWNPEQALELGAALKTVTSAARIKHAEGKAILNAAMKLAQGELGSVIGGQHPGGQTIVIVTG